MTLPSSPGIIGQLRKSSPAHEGDSFDLTASQETEDVTLHPQVQNGETQQRGPETARPWAHFVAGG